MQIFDEAATFSNLKVVKSKTRFIFNHSPIHDLIKQLTEKGYCLDNIIIIGQKANLLGQHIIVGDLHKGSIEQLKLKTEKIKEIIKLWEPRYPLPQGRRIIANMFLTSQLGFLEYNSMWSERDLRAAQSLIDKFINKKKITSGGPNI